jgi:hypothetical protein
MWLVVVPIYHGYMSNLCTESLQSPCVNLTSYYCSDSTINLPSNKVITGGEIQAFSADSTLAFSGCRKQTAELVSPFLIGIS